MNNPTVQPNQIACECGVDHRETGNRNCVVYVILNRLHEVIDKFFTILDLLEFGKNGPMIYCLRRVTMKSYRETMKDFKKFEPIGEQHPEWHLAEQISKLRKYFDQVAIDCAEEKNAMARVDPYVDFLLEEIFGDEEKAVREAKEECAVCFGMFEQYIEEHVNSGAGNLTARHDPDGVLPNVDKEYRTALEAIKLIPESETEETQKLTTSLDRVWKETLRLLCEFRPPRQVLYQSEGVEIAAWRR